MESILLKAGRNRLEVVPELGGTVRQLFLSPTRLEALTALTARTVLTAPEKQNVSGEHRAESFALLAADKDHELGENPWFRGRIMFPFCDRIPRGRYSFEGRSFQLPVNQEDGSAIHGLIHNRPGRIVGRTTTRSAEMLHLAWILGEDSFYPFRIDFDLHYHLDPRGLSLLFHAVNRGTGPAPVGFGWHPYFRLPGDNPDDYTLTLPGASYVEVEENLLPTGRFPRFGDPGDGDPGDGSPGESSESRYDFRTPRKIGGGDYDIAFPVKSPATAFLESSSHRLSLNIAGAFSFFQLFTPPDRSALALEPVTNVTDAFNREDMGMQILAPGKRLSGLVRVELEENHPKHVSEKLRRT